MLEIFSHFSVVILWIEYYVSGQYDVICLEDLVHEIVTIGPHFKEISTYLQLFKLNTPAGGWKKRAKKFVDGGECGDRGDSINDLLTRMV